MTNSYKYLIEELKNLQEEYSNSKETEKASIAFEMELIIKQLKENCDRYSKISLEELTDEYKKATNFEDYQKLKAIAVEKRLYEKNADVINNLSIKEEEPEEKYEMVEYLSEKKSSSLKMRKFKKQVVTVALLFTGTFLVTSLGMKLFGKNHNNDKVQNPQVTTESTTYIDNTEDQFEYKDENSFENSMADQNIVNKNKNNNSNNNVNKSSNNNSESNSKQTTQNQKTTQSSNSSTEKNKKTTEEKKKTTQNSNSSTEKKKTTTQVMPETTEKAPETIDSTEATPTPAPEDTSTYPGDKNIIITEPVVTPDMPIEDDENDVTYYLDSIEASHSSNLGVDNEKSKVLTR